jgi:type I restriction enzyme S subunit
MCEWNECKLEDVAEVQTGPFGSQLKNEQYIIGGTPVVTVEHITNFRIIDFDYPSVTDEDKNRLSKYLLKSGDIIFTRVGSVDLSAFVKPHQDGWMFSSRMLRVRPNQDVDSRFLSYFFQQKRFREYILNISVGATMPSINTEILKGIPVSYPPISEQRAIASVLYSLDDKIDLLHRQNKTLEAMAETLFRQWFVESDTNSYYTFEDLVNSVSIKHSFPKETIIFLNTSDIHDGYVLNHNYSEVKGLPGQAKKSIKKGDILFTEIRPANRRFAYIDFDAEEYVVSTKLMVLRSNDVLSRSIMFFFLKNQETLNWLQMLAEARSGTFPQITFDDFKALEIFVPSGNKLLELTDLFDNILDKTFKNQSQIRTLEKLRDTLLPKLMSGGVRVESQGDIL